ncbi:MAG: YqgE/AlgH family protein [Desulfobacterales bacterium]|nr:YqgE/AlgH family protein [Desulfobacterales bacterium]
MGNIYQASLKGNFLMAMPGLIDPNFSQTVSCICEHTRVGAVGIIINRVHPTLSGKDIFEELNIKYIQGANLVPIFIGGPVHVGEIFLLHGPPFGWKNTLMIKPSLALSNTRDILEAIAIGRGPKSYIIVLGCAGWGEGQLESEIIQNAWLTTPIVDEIIFDLSIETRWAEAVKKIGIDPALLSNVAGHA